jgi:hypothetical protein
MDGRGGREEWRLLAAECATLPPAKISWYLY